MAVKDLLLELEQCVKESGNPILNYMDSVSSGFNEEKFIYAIKMSKLEPRQDLIDLYSWKTGVNGECMLTSFDFEYKLFSFGNFIAYTDTDSLYSLDAVTNRTFTKKYLPIVYGNIVEDPMLINLSKKSKDFGRIYYYCPNVTLSVDPVIVYDSLESCIETILECYRQGAYYIDEKGLLNEIDDKEKEISKKINRKTEYWNY
ncbi:hypothetical protein [Dysgonomonas sp.]